MSNITEASLLEFKHRVETAKTMAAQKEGQLQATEKRLKSEFACETVEAARTEVSTLDEQLTDIDARLEQGVETLKTEYNLTLDEQ